MGEPESASEMGRNENDQVATCARCRDNPRIGRIGPRDREFRHVNAQPGVVF